MNKENINMSFSHLLRESRNWIPGTSPRMTLEAGRTLLELIMTLAVIGILGMGAIKFYKHTVNKVKAQNTAKMIKTIAFERQNMGLRQESGLETTVKGPHSALHVKNGTSGNHQSYFWVETTLSDKDFCDSLKDSGFIQAEFVEVDGVSNGNCTDNSKLAFYFKKNPNAQVYCPSHSTNCDTYGDATGCEEGYYLAGGVCESCGKHVATCEDENTPTSCEEGYNLYGTECSETPPCSVDSDCDVCGECSQEGYCTQTCSIPEPEQNNSCGKNECMVYDNATQSCKYACERKGYLESTGTQYIDSGYIPSNTTGQYAKMQYTTVNNGVTFGSMVSGNRVVGPYYASSSSTTGWWCGWGSSEPNVSALSPTTTDTYEMYLNFNNDRIAKVNDTIIVSGLGNISGNYPNLTLFRRNFSGGYAYLSGKVYKYKITEGTTLVRDFIPVLSPSGEPAFFDRVEQKLYYNAGTGTFDYGPK